MLDTESLEEGNEENAQFNYSILYKIIGGVVIVTILTYFLGGFDNFGSLFEKDPFDLKREYPYPNDGKVRPPQNPTNVALDDYFVIPNKPYFVNNEINYPLLNKDMLTYIGMEWIYPPGVAIPDFFCKWLEMCYGYDITQEEFMNLELHRKLTNSDVGMDYLVPFVRWFYKRTPYRPLYSIWIPKEELAYYEGKDFYDVRIYPGIYTSAYQVPMYSM